MNAIADQENRNKGGRPRKPPSEQDIARVLTSDAGQAAINSAVEQTVARVLATMQRTRVDAGMPAAPSDGGAAGINPADRTFAEQLAMSIAALTDQGAGRERMRISPEEVTKRKNARERMVQEIASMAALGKRPTYRVIAKTYLQETFIEPYRLDPVSKRPVPTEILWSGIPNECMRPIDEVARAIYEPYLESIGGFTQIVKTADQRGMSITPGGLVIKGDSNPRRTVGNIADSAHGSATDSFGLEFKTAFDPTAKEVNVLGTVHPPARQNVDATVRPGA